MTDTQLNVLLVEDSAVQIKVLQLAIRNLSVFNLLHVAKDGVEAMAYLRRDGEHDDAPRPDVILCDINMPRKDGFEVLKEVQADEELRQIPFVMLTTSNDERDIERAYKEGASSFISKPIDIYGLEKILSHFAHYWHAAKHTSRGEFEKITAVEREIEPPDLPAKSIGLLVVEDSQTQALQIQQAISKKPEFKLLATLTDGAEAMAYLRRTGDCANAVRPHLILLDINLPNVDGYQVLQKIKSDPALQTIVIVILTERDKLEDIIKCYNNGANTFLTKPPTPEGLQAILHRFAAYWADEAIQLPLNE